MTLQPITSEFPYTVYEENLFSFYWCTVQVLTVSLLLVPIANKNHSFLYSWPALESWLHCICNKKSLRSPFGKTVCHLSFSSHAFCVVCCDVDLCRDAGGKVIMCYFGSWSVYRPGSGLLYHSFFLFINLFNPILHTTWLGLAQVCYITVFLVYKSL